MTGSLNQQKNTTTKRESNSKILLNLSRATFIIWIILYVVVYSYKFSIGHSYNEGTGFGFAMLLLISYGIALFLTASSILCSVFGFIVSYSLDKSIVRKKLIFYSIIHPIIIFTTAYLVSLYINGTLK